MGDCLDGGCGLASDCVVGLVCFYGGVIFVGDFCSFLGAPRFPLLRDGSDFAFGGELAENVWRVRRLFRGLRP